MPEQADIFDAAEIGPRAAVSAQGRPQIGHETQPANNVHEMDARDDEIKGEKAVGRRCKPVVDLAVIFDKLVRHEQATEHE